jgi:thymidylate kinase
MSKLLRSPRLIILEGVDGMGKTYVARALTERLRKMGIDAASYSFPGQVHGSLGELVHNIHHGKVKVQDIDPASLQLMHVAAHINELHLRIIPDLRGGKWIILDRFWWSTWVYGSASGVDTRALEKLLALERFYWKEHTPDIVFLLARGSIVDPDQLALQKEYERLAVTESTNHPVVNLDNSTRIKTTLDSLLKELVSFDLLTSLEQPHRKPLPVVLTTIASTKTTEAYDSYWRFAVERQRIFFCRLAQSPPPWTQDPILQQYRFTNAYRASDRVSQYLINNVIYSGSYSVRDMVFRILLFKIFNRIGTWEYLERKFGELSANEFRPARYSAALDSAFARGERLYSAAYIMPSGPRSDRFERKHHFHMALLKRMLDENLPERLADARSMEEAFELLRSYPSIGNFLAYQYVSDINYSTVTNFSEMEFVVAGPGAKSGIQKCFADTAGLTDSDVVRLLADRQQIEFERLGLSFPSLWGRPLQLIDCQNLFCEVDKYSRVAHPELIGSGRNRIKQKFHPLEDEITIWYPPKWRLNKLVAKGVSYVQGL